MISLPIAQLQSAPPLGALIGTVSSAPIIDIFNKKWGNTQGVIFGQAGDPYKNNYSHFNNLMNTVIIPVQQQVQELVYESTRPKLEPITSEFELRNISDSMKLPILMHKPVLDLFKKDRIYGFGFDKRNLPDEDVYGRLISNFTAELNQEDDTPETLMGEWQTSDPDLSDDDLEAIRESREFVDAWLEKQLGPSGDRLDPTDLDNVIKK